MSPSNHWVKGPEDSRQFGYSEEIISGLLLIVESRMSNPYITNLLRTAIMQSPRYVASMGEVKST